MLIFETERLRQKIIAKTEKLYRKGELSRQQLWFGAYFGEEIDGAFIGDVEVRYIDPIFGFGVFAKRRLKKMEFIAEYTGKVRKSRRRDKENAYCFEYTIASGYKTPYTIDAEEEGSIARYVNHSTKANLFSALATKDFLSHVILITNREIAEGEELRYDYGLDYWSQRERPIDS